MDLRALWVRLAWLVLVLLLLGCAQIAAPTQQIVSVTPQQEGQNSAGTHTLASPSAATTSREGYPRRPEGLPEVGVVQVVDGDTVDVRLGGQVERLRLIGLNTPETVDPRKPVECFGREASAKAHSMLDGQHVLLEEDATQGSRDKYDRLLRYIWLADGRLFNLEMIAQGFAFEYTYAVPYKYHAVFKQAELRAQEEKRGLWAPESCAGELRPADAAPTAPGTPSPSMSLPDATPAGEGCEPSYPDHCLPPPPPDLDCADISYRRFRVVGPDPHRLDNNQDGIGCEGYL